MAIIVDNCAYEIQDESIITYGVSFGEINFSDEGKLLCIDESEVSKIEEALKISSIDKFGVKICE